MNILWFTWKDSKHPLAGGAETVSTEIRKRLVGDGHVVKVITAQYPGSTERENLDGVEIFRSGNRYNVYIKARGVYKKYLEDWPDVVIDEMNTLPFCSAYYTSGKHILLCYQLAREVWKYQIPFPISSIGFFAEPYMLRQISKKYRLTLTESQSTKSDLEKYGFTNVNIFRVGIDLPHLDTLKVKQDKSHILSLGAIRPMKRTLEAVKAFEYARDNNQSLRLTIAGDDTGPYAKTVMNYVKNSRHCKSITVTGRVPYSERLRLMEEATVILVTSIKEGWGLIVTEANSQGTVAIAYDTDGLRDSIRHNETGLLVRNGDSKLMGESINTLLNDVSRYELFRKNAWQWSKEFTLDNSYNDFLRNLNS